MTGSIYKRKLNSGNEYFYIHLSYQDPITKDWKTKEVSTGLETKDNKRKAEAMIQPTIKKFSYLENKPDANLQIDPDIELCEYLDRWIDMKSHEIDSNTIDTYQCHVNKIKEYFSNKNVPVKDVTPKMLNDYFHYLLKYGKVSQLDGSRGPLSVRTVRDYKNILRQAFNCAIVDDEIIKINPTDGLTISNKYNKDFEEEMLFLKEDEAKDMLVYLDEHAPFLKPIAYFGVYYGLRREEILGLKWSAIDYENRRIHINHVVTGTATIYSKGKTKSKYGIRQLYLTSTAEKCLNDLKEEQDKNKKIYREEYKNKDNYVFTKEDGSPYRPDSISKRFAKEMDKFGHPEITLHKLRHTCISWLFDKGWDVKKIQNWVGDADANTVMNVYAHYIKSEENEKDDIEDMSSSVADLF